MTSHNEIDRARSALFHLDAGVDREFWVRIGMAAKAAGLDFEDFHGWSSQAGNYRNEADCRSTWNSFKNGGIGASTLFHLARESGWRDDEDAQPKRTESRQNERSSAKAGDPPLHDPEMLWQACKPATAGHEYIARKLGLPDGLRVYSGQMTIAGHLIDGALVLPARSLSSGALASLQFILPDRKLFLPGCKLPPDACHVIGGKLEGAESVAVCEGVGQAWSAFQATGKPAVVCFGAGRMAGVSDALAGAFPGVRQIIIADTGKETQCEAIARKCSGAWVEMPDGSPQNFDLNDYHKERGLQAVADLLAAAKGYQPRFKLLTARDLANLPPVRWRVRGVLPETGVAAVFGASGSGKSFLVLDLLSAVAAGRPWFGCPAKAGEVLYIGLEGESGIAQRVRAVEAKHGPLSPGFRFLLQRLDIRKASDRADLVRAVKATGWQWGVVCVDTLNQAAPGMDENSSEAMGEAIAAIKAIQAELGGLVLLVHHTGKDAGRGLRGHSSLLAALDSAIGVARDNDMREWKIHKAKDGVDGEAHPFRLEVVEIGQDEDDGEPVTSCVVVPEERADEAVRRVKLPRGGNQKIIWEALGELLKASVDFGKADAPITRPCIELEKAIDLTRSRLTCASDQKTRSARNAITGLVSLGCLKHREGWLWVA